MNRLLLVCVTVLLGVVTSTIAGPEKVMFPSSYKHHVRYATVDRPDNKTIREIYISPEHGKVVKPAEPLPHGTVITMEVYRARVDAQGEPVKDADGRFSKGDLTGILSRKSRPAGVPTMRMTCATASGSMGGSHPRASAIRTPIRRRVFNTISLSAVRISCLRSPNSSQLLNDGSP